MKRKQTEPRRQFDSGDRANTRRGAEYGPLVPAQYGAVLIVDEFGVWPYDRLAATALFTLISIRYGHGSIILTSNKSFAEWGEVLGDTVIATAILDRLLHHNHVINIRGESYRFREKKRAGFFSAAAPPRGGEDRNKSIRGGQFPTGSSGSLK